jgi:hypothetical protein
MAYHGDSDVYSNDYVRAIRGKWPRDSVYARVDKMKLSTVSYYEQH